MASCATLNLGDDGIAASANLLAKCGILAAPGEWFLQQPPADGPWLRFCFDRPATTIEAAVEALSSL